MLRNANFLKKVSSKKKGSQFPLKLLGPGCPDFLEKFSSKKKQGSQFSPQIAGAWGQWNFAVLRDASETPFGLICSRFRSKLLEKSRQKKKARNFPSNCSGLAAQTFLKNSRQKKKNKARNFPPKLLGPGGNGTLRCCETRPRRRLASYAADSGTGRLAAQTFLEKFSSKIRSSRFSPQIAGTWEQWNLAVLRAASETPFRRNASETPLYRTHACREQSPGGPGDFLDKASSKKKRLAQSCPQIAGACELHRSALPRTG